jgi:adhesin transport system outer membrane protein
METGDIMRLVQRNMAFYLKAALLGTALTLPGGLTAQAASVTDAIELALSTNPNIGIVASNREAVDKEDRKSVV